MRSSSPFLLLLPLLSLFSAVLSELPGPRAYFLDCGATANSTADGIQWFPDGGFISSGVPRSLSLPGLAPTLSTLRSFPSRPSAASALARPTRKFCYQLPVVRAARYLVRTTYFYGGANGPGQPPVFDQIVDGTFWTAVNTTADYAAGVASYYEGVFLASGMTMSVCVAANVYTASDPFISALEVVLLEDSLYNATDFTSNAMGLIARSDFGSTGAIVRYPEDRFDRFWQPYSDGLQALSSTHNITVSDFWNLPPANMFNTALVAIQDESLVLQWPPVPLPNSSYYIALYFADTLPASSRTFSVYLNEYSFYSDLVVTSSGLAVFATNWSLSGMTKITLTPGSNLPPLINAGEIFGLFPLGRLTHTGDVIALEAIKRSIRDPPVDWSGDPCMPREYSWTGVTCDEGSRIRVITLNLSRMGLSGTISPSIASLTALTDISLADNNFSGHIPDLSRLRRLERLHLQDNHLIGTIPPSLVNLGRLHELFLQNNNLTGVVPASLLMKPGLNVRLLPGNHFILPPPIS